MNIPSRPSTPGHDPRALWIVWLAFVGSLPLFGVVSFLVQQTVRPQTGDIVPQELGVVVAISLLFLSGVVSFAKQLSRLPRMLIGLALAEGSALLGLLHSITAESIENVVPFFLLTLVGYGIHMPRNSGQ